VTRFRGGGSLQNTSIFDKLDTDGNGVLSENELEAFKKQIAQAAGDDGKLSDKEAAGFLKNLGIKGKVDGLYGFFNSITGQSDKIKSSVTDAKSSTQTTNYEDGTTAIVDKDGNIVTTQTDGSSVTTNRNGSKLSETHLIKADSGETQGTFKTEYDLNGNKTFETTDTAEKSETVAYNSQGNAITLDVLEKDTSTHDFYDYDANGENPVLKTRIENEGSAEETTTSFKYAQDGRISQTITSAAQGGEDIVTDYEYSTAHDDVWGEGQTCTQITNKGKENESVRVETSNDNGRTVVTKNSDGTTTEKYIIVYDEQHNEAECWAGETTTTPDGRTITAFPDGDGVKTTVTIPGETGCTIVTKTNGSGENEYQSFTQNGETTTVQYTPDGNTKTIMQSHETIDTICTRYGVSKDELLTLNSGKTPDDFGPGASIVIPGEIPASDMVGRKDYEGVADDVKNNNNELKRQHRQENINRLENEVYLDPKTYTENGQKVKMNEAVGLKEQYQGSSDGNFYTETVTEWGNEQQYQVVGKTKGGEHYIVRDKENQLYYANKELTHIEHLSTEEMGQSINFKKGTGQKRVVTFDKEDSYGGKKEIMLTGKKDQYGNELAVDSRGHEVKIDKKTGRAFYVGSKYDTQLQSKNRLENNIPALGTSVTKALSSELDYAEDNLDDYLKHETYVEKALDKGASLWNSENRESVVKEKFAQNRAKLAELDKYKNNPEQYAKKFEQTFGVPFDSRAVTNYLHANPEQKEEARIKAFGTGEISNMLGTVDAYIDSQIEGAQTLEDGSTLAANLLPGGTFVAVGLQAGFSADKAISGRLSAPADGSRYGHTLSEWNAQDAVHNISTVALDAGVSYMMKGKKAKALTGGNWKISGEAMKQSAKQVLQTGGKEGKAALAKNTSSYVAKQSAKEASQALDEQFVKDAGMMVVDGTSGLVTGDYNEFKNTGENCITSSLGKQFETEGKGIVHKGAEKTAQKVNQKFVKPAVNKFGQKAKGVITRGLKHLT